MHNYAKKLKNIRFFLKEHTTFSSFYGRMMPNCLQEIGFTGEKYKGPGHGEKKSFKMPHTYIIIFGVILFAALLTLFIPLLIVLFSLGGTVFGMGEESIPFVMILVPMFIAMGCDAVVGIMCSYVATQIGFGTS